jgi:hypothetical protein
MRRVVASSDSKSGNRAASGPGLSVALLVLLDLLGDFLADFLADFLVDLLDFFDLLEDLERADVLAMNHLIERVLDNLARSLTAVRSGSAAVATLFHCDA